MIHRRGFTLVEVLLSLVILIILASSIGWAVREMREKTMILRRVSDDLAVCTSIYELLDAAITNGLALDPGSGGAGIRGNSESIDIVSRGVLADLEADQGALAGLTRLRVEFDPRSPVLRVGRSGGTGTPSMQPVSRRIEHIRFRYHNGQEWGESFDSAAQGGLPVAIEVSIWIAGALQERADPPEPDAFADTGASGESDPFEFDGMGAPIRGDLDEQPDVPERRPDRFRIFTVLDGPVVDAARAELPEVGGLP